MTKPKSTALRLTPRGRADLERIQRAIRPELMRTRRERRRMKRSITILAQGVFLLMGSVAVAQIPSPDWLQSDWPGMTLQQFADITVLGDSAVVIEQLDKDSVTQKVVLSAPSVKLTGRLGEVFYVGDRNSPPSGFLLEGNAVAYLGDLELQTTVNPDSSKSDYWRVTVYNSLVEIRTELVTNSHAQKNPTGSLGVDVELLNQGAEHTRAVVEEIRRRRNQ